jgi:hypothetical protein
MGTRRKAKSDLKIEQGKRRDAYFAQIRREGQPKAEASSPKSRPATAEA